MAEQKVKLTELPTATDTVDTAQLLINQNSTDQKLAVTHFLRAKNNLSELTNVSQARANLDVPSVDEVNDKLTGFIDGANTFLAGASLASRSDFIWDEESKSWYYWKGTLPKDVPAASTPASTGGVGDNAWGEVGSDASLRAMLATSAGAGMIGALDSDGNATTVQAELDGIDARVEVIVDEKIEPIEESIESITPKEIYTIFDHTKQTSTLDYGAFCDGVVVGEFEYLIHREGQGHTDYNTPATSQLRILKKDSYTGEISDFALISPLAGYDWRDPSITWFPIAKKLVVTCATYDIANSTWNKAIVQYYNLDGTISFTSWLTEPTTFQWGKAVETPAGFTLLCGYSAGLAGSASSSVFRGNAASGAETGFTKISTPLVGDSGIQFIEPSIHIWNNLLILVTRCNNPSTGADLVLRMSYTKDLGGASGWSSVAVWPGLNYNGVGQGLNGVAPRLTSLPDGGLCLSAGFRKASTPPQRGSIACSVTYDFRNFSQFNILYDGVNPGLPNFGGYSSLYVRSDGYVGLYTFEEVPGSPSTADAASTYLKYVPLNGLSKLSGNQTVKKLRVSMYAGAACFGIAPVWNNLTITGQYAYFTLKRQFNCKGIGLVCNSLPAGATLEITNTVGTVIATTPALSSGVTSDTVINLTFTTPVLLNQGVYRIRFVQSGVGVGRIGYLSNGAYTAGDILVGEGNDDVITGYIGYGDGTSIPSSSINSTIPIGLIHNS
ncbi:TPA: hypothetical protein O8T83_003794 [Enterobacter cloacae]|nr:hypothetical protein [Enterobacter cloacae]